MLDSKRGEDRVVDQRRSQVGQHARCVIASVLVQVLRDKKVQHSVAEELQSLITVSDACTIV